MSLTLKSIKGAVLTTAEADANFQHLDSLLLPMPTINSPDNKLWWINNDYNDEKIVSCSDESATVITVGVLPNIKAIAYHESKLCSRIFEPEIVLCDTVYEQATKNLTLGHQTVTFDHNDFPYSVYYAYNIETEQPYDEVALPEESWYKYGDSLFFHDPNIEMPVRVIRDTDIIHQDITSLSELQQGVIDFGVYNFWKFDGTTIDDGLQGNQFVLAGSYSTSAGYLSGNGSTVSIYSNLTIPLAGTLDFTVFFDIYIPSSTPTSSGINFIIGEAVQEYNIEFEALKTDSNMFSITIYSHKRATSYTIASLLLDRWYAFSLSCHYNGSTTIGVYSYSDKVLTTTETSLSSVNFNDSKKYQISPVGSGAFGYIDSVLIKDSLAGVLFEAYVRKLYNPTPMVPLLYSGAGDYFVVKNPPILPDTIEVFGSKVLVDGIYMVRFNYDYTGSIFFYGLFSMSFTGLIGTITLKITLVKRS